MNLVDTDVRHGGHRHGGHRGECFSGVTIFQRFMFIAQIFPSEFRTVERCLVAFLVPVWGLRNKILIWDQV